MFADTVSVARFLRILVVGIVLGALLAAPAAAYKVVRDTLPGGAVGTPYSFQLNTTGGTGPHTFKVIVGGLPAGLSLSSSGLISGTPTAAGQSSFWVQAKDAGVSVSEAPFVINIDSKLIITTGSLAPGVVGSNYSAQLTLTGGSANSWSISAGSLPAGLSISGSGVISGVPTAAGTSTFTVLASNSSKSDTKTLTIIVVRPLSVSGAGFPPLVVGKPFTAQLNVGGGLGGVTFAVTGGALPTGLILDPVAGVIDGTPRRSGTFTAIVAVQSSFGLAATSPLKLTVRAQVGFITRTLPRAKVGRRYAAQIVVQGGILPVTLSSTSTFPPGLQLDAETGRLSGVPRAAGVYRVTVVAADSYGGSTVRRFTIVVGR